MSAPFIFFYIFRLSYILVIPLSIPAILSYNLHSGGGAPMANALKTGDEHFYFDGSPIGFLLNDFWRWQSSDLLMNTTRGILAEFIVAQALDIDANRPRVNWEPFDLLFQDGWTDYYGKPDLLL
jgi:hypothetical protein